MVQQLLLALLIILLVVTGGRNGNLIKKFADEAITSIVCTRMARVVFTMTNSVTYNKAVHVYILSFQLRF